MYRNFSGNRHMTEMEYLNKIDRPIRFEDDVPVKDEAEYHKKNTKNKIKNRKRGSTDPE